MKNKLFNPFIYLAGGKALAIGLAAMLVTAVLAWLSHSHFDGVLDFHKSVDTTLPIYISLAEQGIILACLTIFFYAAARIFSTSSVRFIDIIGTLALARWPMVFMAICGFGMKAITKIEDIDGLSIGLGLFSITFVVWMMALSYNAFSVSSNLKGGKCTWIFIICVILAEILAHLLCHQLYN